MKSKITIVAITMASLACWANAGRAQYVGNPAAPSPYGGYGQAPMAPQPNPYGYGQAPMAPMPGGMPPGMNPGMNPAMFGMPPGGHPGMAGMPPGQPGMPPGGPFVQPAAYRQAPGPNGGAPANFQPPPPTNYPGADVSVTSTGTGGSCGTDCCDQCGCENCCCCSHLFFGGFEYMLGWRKKRYYPPLVTTSPPGTIRDDAGVLFRTGTRTVFGDDTYDGGARSGGKATLGMWCDPCKSFALVGNYFLMEEADEDYFSTSLGDPIIARPFFNTFLDRQDSLLVAYPGVVEGSINVDTQNNVQGAELYGRGALAAIFEGVPLLDGLFSYTRGTGYRVDFIGGYRWTKVSDDLAIHTQRTSIDPVGALPVGTKIATTDVFATDNSFHGGTLGLMGDVQTGPVIVSIWGKCTLGNQREEVAINGNNTTITPDGMVSIRNSGLLAMPTNIGNFHRNHFVAVPEAGISVRYAVTKHLELSLGYSFLYWSSMILAGDQVDTFVNLTQLVPAAFTGPARPAFNFRETDFWLQTINAGGVVHW